MTHARALNHVTNGHNKQITSAIDSITNTLDAAREAATVGKVQLAVAAGKTQKVVKAHPLKSVFAALGGGFLLGAFVVKAFGHKPQLGELIHDRLGVKRRVARAIQGWL